jgi:hypothetical protein
VPCKKIIIDITPSLSLKGRGGGWVSSSKEEDEKGLIKILYY